MPDFDPSKPFTIVPASPEDAESAFDPSKPFSELNITPESGETQEESTFDPSKPFTKGYTIADVKATDAKTLAEDPDFAPTRFSAEHEAELQQDPEALEKVIEAYRLKETKGSTILEKGKKAVTGFVPALKHFLGGLYKSGKTLEGVADAPIRIGKAYLKGGDAPADEVVKIAGEAMSIPASLESNVAAYNDLGVGLGRSNAENIKGLVRAGAKAVTGEGDLGTVTEAVKSRGKTELTPEEFRARYFQDVGLAKAAAEATRGQGAVAEALGMDADKLKEFGIEIDPSQVEALSVVTDPLNYVPVGAAVGVVGKGAKGMASKIIARTVSPQQATALAKTLNKAKDVIRTGAGDALSGAGRFAEAAGRGIQTNLRRIGGGSAGFGLGAILGQNVYSALGGAVVAKGVPAAITKAGTATKAVGEMLTGARPTPKAISAAGEVLKQGAIGTAEGAALTAPFILGSRTEDEEALLGMIPVAGLGRAVSAGGPKAARMAGEAAQDKLAQEIFKQVQQPPAVEKVPYYGTDQGLDTTHAQVVQGFSGPDRNLLTLVRNAFAGTPLEFYALDEAGMKKQTGSDHAQGFAVQATDVVKPDGTSTPIFRVFLNTDANALPHELLHALEFLDPAKEADFVASVNQAMTPEQRANFEYQYNSAWNGGLPEALWTRKLTPEGLDREVAAEAFSRTILGQDLSGVPPTVRKKAALLASSILEKLGAPLAKTGAAPEVGGSSLGGVRGGTDSVKFAQEWVSGLLKRIETEGGLVPTERIGVSPLEGSTAADLTGGNVSARVPTATPAAPAAPAAPAPAAPTPTPTAPTPVPTPRNIRVTRAQQNTMARRTGDIGKQRALAAAEKIGPEVAQRVNEISDYIEAGAPVLEIEHQGVKTESTAEAPAGRSSRRAEQEAAYVAEAMGTVPQDVRESYQKTFVPVRWEVVGGKPQLLAMSLDKVLANISRSVKDAVSAKAENLIPYEIKDGKLTDSAWYDAVEDLKTYSENQANGFRGDGQKLERPAAEVGVSIPEETPGYTPKILSAERANFQNLIQGLNPPLTARETKGQTPGNVKGQILAEINKRQPETPSVIRPEDIKKQEFKSAPGRSIKETNPLRNQLAAAGVPVRELIEVTERVNAPDILSVKPRTDLEFRAPVTDTIRGGFKPKTDESVADFGKRVLSMSKEDFNAMVAEDSLTGMAYDVGLALKDKENVGILQTLATGAGDVFRQKLGEGDIDSAMDFALRKQFFDEAYQAATNTGGAVKGLERLRPGQKSPFPAIDEETSGKFKPEVNQDVQKLAEEVAGKPLREVPYAPINPEVSKELANFYESAKSDPQNPEVQKSYRALADETLKQYRAMEAAGYTIEPWTGEGEPYKSSDDMRRDVTENKHLYFLQTAKSYGPEAEALKAGSNPMLEPSGVKNYLVNDVFRAVHDFFGHVKQSFQFGPRGEFNAWKAHSEMYSPEAQGALAAETLAQNSWVNFFGDHAERPITERPFGEQKATVVPPELIEKARQQFEGSFKPLPLEEEVGGRIGENAKRGIPTQEFWINKNTGKVLLAPDGHEEAANDYFAKKKISTPTSRIMPYEAMAELGFVRGVREAGFSDPYVMLTTDATLSKSAVETLRNISEASGDAEVVQYDVTGMRKRRTIIKGATRSEDEGVFKPSTEKGRELETKGYGVERAGNPANPEIRITKNGISVADITAVRKNPEEAYLSFVNVNKPERGKGLSEVLYRELGQALKELGVTKLSGIIIDPRAVKTRAKIFPETQFQDIYDQPLAPAAAAERISAEGAVRAASPIDETSAFKPKEVKRDEQGRPLLADGLVDFARYYKELAAAKLKDQEERDKTFDAKKYEPTKAKTSSKAPLTGWILPNGEFTDLQGSSVHEEFLAAKADELNKKFGTNFGKTADVEERLTALNKGFVRWRFDQYGQGEANIEANVRFWTPKLRRTIASRLQDNVDRLGSVRVSLLNDKGKVVDSASVKLYDLEDDAKPEAAISDALRDLRGGRALPKELDLPGLKLPDEEQAAQIVTKRRVTKAKEAFPEAIVPTYQKVEGKFVIGEDGKPKAVAIEYGLDETPVAKEAAKGLRGDAERREAIADALAKKLEKTYKKAVANPQVKAGEKWYSTARTRLRKVFGDDSKFMAELLGATSARTPVETNYRFALDAYNRFKSGEYDELISKYREGKAQWEQLKLDEFVKDTGNPNPSRRQFLDWWVAKHDLLPRQSNGKKFGANSRAVLRVLDGSWREDTLGPKTPNFAGNLTGDTFEATIDVWAARLLHRLANEGTDKRWRILPENETGVSDADFELGQAAFRKAADKLGVKPDSLQAILWFAEKEHWAERGWTRGSGAEKSDFNSLLAETEETPEGKKQLRDLQKNLFE